jgi:CRP/FNR family transcriptional regulator, anaerobic regulatory protein
MEQLLGFLETIHPLSEGLKIHLSKTIKIKELPKKEFLLKAGHVCREVCFIKKGLLRCFYINEDTEVCSWFMKEGDVIYSVESFLLQRQSYESIQAIEEAIVFYIDYSELQYIYNTYPEFNFIGRVLTEKYYTLSEQRLYSLRMHRADERYSYMMNKFPDLMQRVPLKYLASYMGMTEVWLSKVRAKRIS